MNSFPRFLVVFLLSSAINISAADLARFIPATSDNTAPALSADGGSWHQWGSTLAFHSDKDANAPMLRTRVDGLKPGSTYEVDAIFLMDDGADAKDKWGIRAGISMADLRGYSIKSRTPLPDLIGLDHAEGKVRLWKNEQSGSATLGIDDEPGLKPFAASLGHYKTDEDGTLIVYVDDVSGGFAEMISAYSGVAVTLAKDGVTPDIGGGNAAAMVRAARAGDWETVRRESGAGADPNVPDLEGLTALFYACIADDEALVKELLKKGARPDPDGQTLTPLWVSAKLANPGITRLLLDAGAVIETECLSARHVALNKKLPESDTNVNSVSAVIQAGSVEILRMFLERQPDLDLGKAVYGQAYEFGKSPYPNTVPPRKDVISDAVFAGNTDMAVFLIERGLRLDATEGSKLPRGVSESSTRNGAQTLMIAAMLRQPPMTEVVDALSKRGVPVVRNVVLKYNPLMEPWDALSAAVAEGHTELVRRWLPLADGARPEYKALLAALADASFHRETAEIVRQHFPDARLAVPTWWTTPVLDTSATLAVDAAELKPRRALPKHFATKDGKELTLAVLATDDAAGPADLLAVHASGDASWQVVDRREISKLLAEQDIRSAGGLDSGTLNEIGDRFSADIIVLASMIGSGDAALLQFEAHSVATGLPFHRAHALAKTFKPEPFSMDFLKQIRERNHSVDAGNPPNAITFLGVFPAEGLDQGRSLQGILNAGLLQSIDMSDGLIAMTREQITPLVEEQALAAKGGMWGAMWTLEGGVRPVKDSQRIILELRLNALDRKESFDVAVEGLPDAPRELVSKAWAGIAAHLKRNALVPDTDGSRAKLEGERLLQEARLLIAGYEPWKAAQPAEAALYLGANRTDSLMMRKQAAWAKWLHINRQMVSLKQQIHKPTGYPVRPHIQEYDINQLGETLDLLRLTSNTLDQILAAPEATQRNEQIARIQSFWEDIEYLTHYRCRLVVSRMDAEQTGVLSDFDQEIQILWKKMLPLAKEWNILGERFISFQNLSHNFRQLPWLGRIFAEEIFRELASHNHSGSALFSQGALRRIPGDEPRLDVMADVLEKHLKPEAPDYLLRKQEIALLRATEKDRPRMARALLESGVGQMGTAASTPRWMVDPLWIGLWLPSHGFHINQGWDYLFTNPLNSLVVAPRISPDLMFRPSAYLRGRREYTEITASGDHAGTPIRHGITQELVSQTGELAKQSAPASVFRLLDEIMVEKSALIALPGIEDHLRKIRTMHTANTNDTFGKNGEFRYVRHPESIQASVLTDLRGISPKGHPVISFARIDPKHPHLLWLALHILPEPELVLHGPLISLPDPKAGVGSVEPWLVAVDCRDGSVAHRVNLAQTALPGVATPMRREAGIGRFMPPGIAFNENQLMVLFRWETDKFDDWRRHEERLVTVDRKSGKAAVMPKLHRVVDSQLRENGGKPWLAMVGLGSDFYVLEETEYKGIARLQNTSSHRALWKFGESGDATKLTEPHRRPAKSPFDAEDRNPKLLRVDGDKILLASSWGYFGHYDPKARAWVETAPRTEAEWHQHVDQIDSREHYSWRFPFFPIAAGGGGTIGFTPLPDQLEPATLVIQNNRDYIRVPVTLTPPQDSGFNFVVSPDFAEDAGWSTYQDQRPAQMIALKDFAQSAMVRPILINQTDDNLILGLNIAVRSHHLPTDEPVMLPILWKISKQENLEILQTGSKR